MFDLTLLDNNEFSILCNSIPYQMVVNYFQKNPKEFAKIRPGFRPTSIKSKDAKKLLFENRDRGFISSFIEKVTKGWLKEIIESTKNRENEGLSEISAYIHTLPDSFFAENVSAFFKLIGKDISGENLTLIEDLVALLKTKNESIKKFDAELARLKSQCNSLESQLNKQKHDSTKMHEKNNQIAKLLTDFKTLENRICSLEQQNDIATQKIKEQEDIIFVRNDYVSRLKENISSLKQEKNVLEEKIRKQIEEEHQQQALNTKSLNPIRPKDISEFKDYFGYNLESIGLDSSETARKKMLSDFISQTIFQGKPLICNQQYASTLIKCISNALIGTLDIPTIQYSPDFNEKSLRALIEKTGRILVLENFLGNYNESLLISNLKQYKNKIIVLTFLYDGTLKYLSKDFFAYCNYISLSAFPSLLKVIIPNEDSSVLEEKEYECEIASSTNRFAFVLKSIMSELGFSKQVTEVKSLNVFCEQDLICSLYFDILPYYYSTFAENPLHYSETLQKQISKNSCNSMFEEWTCL